MFYDKNIKFERKKTKKKLAQACCITKPLTKFRILKYFKTIIKSGDTFPFGKFAAEVLIFRSSRSQMFFKIGVLKNFSTLTGKHLCWLCSPSFTEHLRWLLLDFRGSKYLFKVESGIYCWQSHRLLLQIPQKLQKQPMELFKKRFFKTFWKHLC